MRRQIILVCMAVIFCLASGCNGPVSSNKAFPSFLAGTWQMEGGVWTIVIEPNGTVSSAFVPMGEAEVRPNQTTEFEMADGSKSHITGGEFLVEYNSSTRELFVSIEQKEIYIVLPGYTINGNGLDTFRGPVSKDGSTWNAGWTAVFDYGPLFPQDVNDIYTEPIVFKKVAEPNAPVK